MVGLVVISHSPALAKAAVELALEMVHGEAPPIAIAAGIDAAEFGTDAIAVKQAIEEVDSADGVVVLMDLGSAVLSGEFALDLIDPDLRERVQLISAPLVEGLVAAVVQASGGEPIEAVVREAMDGLYAKQVHLGMATEALEPAENGGEGDTITLPVSNVHGLHARPAARLVAEAKRFDAELSVRNVTTGSVPVPATSLSRVAALGVLHGHEIAVTAAGRQRTEALEAIATLASRNFDERDDAVEPVAPVLSAAGKPLPGSPGIAIGKKWSIGGGELTLPDPDQALDPIEEWRTLRQAVAGARGEILRTRTRMARQVDEANAAIFDAHLMLLEDDDVLAEVHSKIDEGQPAALAWKSSLERVEAEWASLDDPYLNARAADVRAVTRQVIRQMMGASSAIASQRGVLVAADLTPNDTAQLDTSLVNGFVTAYGSPTSHSAILARALGIPSVVSAGRDILDVPDGTLLIVDGSAGIVLVDPDEGTIASYAARADEMKRVAAAALSKAAEPAVTTDGFPIEVAANIGALGDGPAVVARGGDAVGLLRSEFLFLNRTTEPSRDEQIEQYRRIAEELGGRRLTVRTLDVGGDKPLRYVAQPTEANPFLGLRGIRFGLEHRELLRNQIAALIAVAADYPVSIMFPMIATTGELAEVLAVCSEVLDEAGDRPDGLELGMMVEVPAAAINAEAFIPMVDFLSIGTNDLTQYALAAERGNQAVAHLADSLDPAVLRLIAGVTAAASGQARVAVCGEAAADPAAVPVLVGLGVDELSVTPAAIPQVKDEVRRWSMAEARQLAAAVLELESALQVRTAIERAHSG